MAVAMDEHHEGHPRTDTNHPEPRRHRKNHKLSSHPVSLRSVSGVSMQKGKDLSGNLANIYNMLTGQSGYGFHSTGKENSDAENF
jgi:hypothetical protein